MGPNDRDKLNRIEELKSKLFSRNYQNRIDHRDSFSHSSKTKIPDMWKTKMKEFNSREKFFMHTSVFKKFFTFALSFFILTLGYASYVFFIGGNTVSNDNIDISILGNAFTAGGEELPLIIGVTNRNSSALDLVDLIIEYPNNSSSGVGGGESALERNRISLGTIPAGVIRNENIKVVFFGPQGSIRPMKISIEYRVEGSNAIFVKEKLYEVVINSTPINLSVDAPSTISPNQNITLNIKITLNATTTTPKVLVKLGYPTGFQFIQSAPAPTLGNNVWNLGDLAPGVERSISITGKMLDVFDGEEKFFNISSGLQSPSDKSAISTVFNFLSHLVVVKKPSISAELFINGILDRGYAVDTKTSINGEIRFVNNLDTKINDLEIRVKILGNAVNRKTVNAQQGFYNSGENVIVWDKNSQNDFREISPGDTGSVSFSVSPLSIFSSVSGLLVDPSINIEVNIKGKQSIEGFSTEELINSASTSIRIISDVGLGAKALYFSGPFTNTGPIPPKVEKQTSYTIVWSVSNTANNISKAVVRSTLPPWIRFAGLITPAGEDLKYNPSTKEIVWNIGRIPKGTGITVSDRSVSFQVILTPSLSQLGNTPTLVNDAVLTGHDDFANVDVRANKASVNTAINNNDSLFPPNGAAVVE